MLGIIHNLWRPVPGRIKDFIAMPRPNLYQSLHTSVITEDGTPFEVQIRTEEMHKMAEEGIAAHWKYKDGPVSAQDEQRLAWLRQVVEWQRDVSDPNEFLSTLKIDLYPEEVYTFTPKGKVVVLPRDSTPIDFAYSIHTEVGHSLRGRESQRPHGAAAPQAAQRRHRRDPDPDRAQAQPRLAGHRQVVARPQQDQALAQCSSARARHRNRPQADRERSAQVSHLAQGHQGRRAGRRSPPTTALGRPDDLMAGIGYGKYSARQMLGRMAPAAGTPLADEEEEKPGGLASVVRRVFGGDQNNNAIRVKGHGDLLVYRARCCNPIRGEAIVGYVTRGKGVAVHAVNCPNVTNLMYEPERKIDVEWAQDDGTPSAYPVKLTVFCDDRFGMLKQITAVISDTKTNIRNIEARTSNGQANVDIVLDIADLKHLENIVNGVRKIPGVHDVQRLQKI